MSDSNIAQAAEYLNLTCYSGVSVVFPLRNTLRIVVLVVVEGKLTMRTCLPPAALKCFPVFLYL